jgi:hypothetical protein
MGLGTALLLKTGANDMGTKVFDNALDLITFTRASGGTYLDSDGLLKTATNNIPRIEYAADGTLKGLLIEEQRTNLVTWSEDFTNGFWTKSNTAVTADAAIAPDGATTADLIYPLTSGNQRHIRVATYNPWTGTLTASFYAKTAGIRYLVVVDTDGAGAGVGFDLQDGAVTISGAAASDGTTASVTDAGNGWYRCTYTSTNGYFYLMPSDTVSGVFVTANGTDGLYIWGAQLEAGSFPTSYIPTSGATATRSADIASIPVTDFGYNTDAGTLVVEASALSAGIAANLNDGSDANRAFIFMDSAYQGLVTSGGVAQAVLDNGTISAGTVYKIAMATKLNDFALSLDGAAAATDVSGSMPVGVTTMNIGSRLSGVGPINGHIKSIQYFPRRLSNAQLQELTT